MRNRFFIASDIILLALSVVVSFVLRLDMIDTGSHVSSMLIFGACVLIIVPTTFALAGVYSRYWRYATTSDIVLLGGALALASALSGAITLVVARWTNNVISFPRWIPVIFLLVGLVATLGPRLLYRMSSGYLRRRTLGPDKNGTLRSSRVLVLGAGEAGAIMVRELRNNPQLNMQVVGFIDDDLGKHDAIIHGVPVMGGREDIGLIVKQHRVDQIIIAMPASPGKAIRELVQRCEDAGITPKIMPGIYELIGGKVSVSQLRTVQIEDLLRREPVRTDTQAVRELIRGKRVLVTGGGGSIGSELCRQVLSYEPAELTLVGHGENSLFEIHNELMKHSRCVKAVVADIRMPERVRAVLDRERPQIIFHAAAHKHVPLMEWNPAEAITNNVLGTRNILDAALGGGVECFVMISTDKAVNPSSVMGASKRVAEFLVHQAAMDCANGMADHHETPARRYCAVRFGNVLGSRGSVVLTFKKQIAAGGPVTVTDPDMKRYFMTIPEAVQLVLQAAVQGRGGEVFVLDMGEPVKIVDLAKDLIRLSGLEVGRDIDIEFTGTRPGEKLFEELFLPNETYQRTPHAKVFIAANASNFIPANLMQGIARLEDAACRNDDAEIIAELQQLIPEFEHKP